MNRLIDTSNSHSVSYAAQPDYAKNLIHLGLTGVGSKIFWILAIQMNGFYFIQSDENSFSQPFWKIQK